MAHKLNILFLASWFPSRKDAFNGDFIERHAKTVALKHFVTVIYAEGLFDISQIEREIEEKDNLKIIRVYFPKKAKIYNQLTKFRLYLKEIKKLNKIDLIHVNVTYPVGLIALYFKLKLKIPYVITEHWTGYLPIDPAKISFIREFLTKKIVKNASFLLPVSENLGNAMNDLGLNCKSVVIRNVIDFEVFRFQDLRKSNIVKFLHISNLSEQKNVKGILSVADKLWKQGFDFELHIGGNGDVKHLLDFKKESIFSDKLIVFGELSQQQVSEKMNQSDCFILFSLFENQPCVQIESFASGLPVIAADVGGIKEVFPDGFGQIISPNNEGELLVSMKNFIENKMNLKSRTEINQFAQDNFSMLKISTDFDQIYKEVLK